MNNDKQYSPDDFAGWLINHIAQSDDTSTVDLIPAPCGVGKSYSMTVQISEALKTYNSGGILLVTDELERMHNYLGDNGNSYLCEYISRNASRILVYEAANAKADYDKLFKIPIILMTTQRFFNLSRDQVMQLTKSYIPKRNVFIDERAPLSETIKIDISTFNDIDTILCQRLDNTASGKEWLINQWRNLRTRYYEIMKEYEASHDDYELSLWHVDEDHNIATDSSRFKQLVFKTYPDKLRKGDYNILKKLRAIIQMVECGALFTSRRRPSATSKDEYSNFFLVTLDHSDLLLDIGSKVVILDGSGGIDPVYKAWYVNQIDCSNFNRDLSKLTINIVDINTSRNNIAINPNNNENLKAIIEYVKSIPKIDAIFTYGFGKESEIENNNTVERVFYREFHDAGIQTGHFGGLKGTNKFKDFTDIVQVGLNRISDEYYLALAIDSTSKRYPPDKKAYCIVNYKKAAISIMLNSLLADIEQNLFRGTIRNADNEKEQIYTIIYNAKPKTDKKGRDRNVLSQLTEMISERYGRLGAKINVIDTPYCIAQKKTESRKTKDGHKTNAQKIVEYLDGLACGDKFKRIDILNATGISAENYKSTLRRNKHLKERLESMKTDINGWYQVRA